MNRYNVGQVVYVVSSEHNKVLPLLVVEEITKKTMQGDEVFYKVVYGTDRSKTRLLTDVKGDVFTSLAGVRDFLMQNVTSWVNGQLDVAKKAQAAWYKTPDPTGLPDDVTRGQLPEQPLVHPFEPYADPPSDANEASLVELPNGQVVKARVKGIS